MKYTGEVIQFYGFYKVHEVVPVTITISSNRRVLEGQRDLQRACINNCAYRAMFLEGVEKGLVPMVINKKKFYALVRYQDHNKRLTSKSFNVREALSFMKDAFMGL